MSVMRRIRIALVVFVVVIAPVVPAALRPAPAAAEVVAVEALSATRSAVFIHSPAMGRTIQVQVLHPASDGPRPSYYLLDGLDPGSKQSTWTNATDAENFFHGRNVNVVLPMGGQASYYSDWSRDDPRFGRYKWETFLTRELPPIIDGQFNGNGANAIGGLSMGGQAAYILAARHPAMYRAVAGYSACPDTGMAQGSVMFSIATRGGNPGNMWGPPGSPEWAAHDPALMLDGLRGKALWLSSGSGVPGPHEAEIKPQLPEAIFLGGPIEVGVNGCVAAFEHRLRAAGMAPHVEHDVVGTHSWSYWQDHLHASWPTVAGAIGA